MQRSATRDVLETLSREGGQKFPENFTGNSYTTVTLIGSILEPLLLVTAVSVLSPHTWLVRSIRQLKKQTPARADFTKGSQ